MTMNFRLNMPNDKGALGRVRDAFPLAISYSFNPRGVYVTGVLAANANEVQKTLQSMMPEGVKLTNTGTEQNPVFEPADQSL